MDNHKIIESISYKIYNIRLISVNIKGIIKETSNESEY